MRLTQGKEALRGWQSRRGSCIEAANAARIITTLAIAVLVAALSRDFLQSGGREAFAAARLRDRLTFNDLQLTNCYYRNQFFGKNVRAAFALFDSTGTVQIDPPTGGPYLIGRFTRYGATPTDPAGIASGHTGPGIVSVNCDGTT